MRRILPSAQTASESHQCGNEIKCREGERLLAVMNVNQGQIIQ
jgi:hypothetical protein